jgi:hypothetical protein
MKNKKSASGYNCRPCFFLFIKSIEYLNFRHFTHFAILGITLYQPSKNNERGEWHGKF